MKIICLFFYLLLSFCAFKQEDEISSDLRNFQADEFTVFGYQELSDDLIIDAKSVKFLPDTKIKLGPYNIQVNSKSVDFSNAHLFSFNDHEIGDCEKDGRSSGSITINSKEIFGSPLINLAGQNAGRNGWGYSIHYNDNEVYVPEDKKILQDRYLVINPCKFSKGFGKNDFVNYWRKKTTNAGYSGNLKINHNIDKNNFFPEVLSVTPKGNYQFFIRADYGDHLLRVGLNREPMLVCFYNELEFEICEHDYLSLMERLKI